MCAFIASPIGPMAFLLIFVPCLILFLPSWVEKFPLLKLSEIDFNTRAVGYRPS